MNNMSEKLEQNISQLKTANLELKKDIDKKEKLEQMRSDFLSNVSHVLNTNTLILSPILCVLTTISYQNHNDLWHC